jgi:hypothetical protein
MRVFLPSVALLLAVLLPQSASARQAAPSGAGAAALRQGSNVPPAAEQATNEVEDVVRRFRIGVDGGVGLDPELVMFGAHGNFGPIFRPGVDFRPGIEIGLGEITTLLAINFDVVYTFSGTSSQTGWRPYIGAGPAIGLSHRGFETEDEDNVDTDLDLDDGNLVRVSNRFDFSDTDFNGGVNFIAGARNPRGWFFELKATAWGVSNIRLMTGFDF